jgi:hypothetical protein
MNLISGLTQSLCLSLPGCLKLFSPPACTSQVLGLQTSATMPGTMYLLKTSPKTVLPYSQSNLHQINWSKYQFMPRTEGHVRHSGDALSRAQIMGNPARPAAQVLKKYKIQDWPQRLRNLRHMSTSNNVIFRGVWTLVGNSLTLRNIIVILLLAGVVSDRRFPNSLCPTWKDPGRTRGGGWGR